MSGKEKDATTMSRRQVLGRTAGAAALTGVSGVAGLLGGGQLAMREARAAESTAAVKLLHSSSSLGSIAALCE